MRQPAKRVTFRIRKAIFKLHCDVARNAGSNRAGLCQLMILTGSILEFMRLENEDELREFLSVARVNQLADGIDNENPVKSVSDSLSSSRSSLATGPLRNTKHPEGSELVKVRLPPGIIERIDLYAKLTRATRSVVLKRFFEKGLLAYMGSQRALMAAVIQSAQGNIQAGNAESSRKTNYLEGTGGV